jgi:hypothetical protein
MRHFFPRVALALLFVVLPARAQTQTWAWDDGTVPFVVTPMEIVERMLRMAEVKKDDYVIDLGSGDDRIIIEAARAARALAWTSTNLVGAATENARAAGVGDRALSRRWTFSMPTCRPRRSSRCICCRTSTPSCCRACCA